MSLLVGLEAQPAFPHEDLTDDNAAMLELMLANKPLVDQAHLTAESIAWLYRVAHPTIAQLSPRMYEEDERLRAIDHGVAMYEAIGMFVCSSTEADMFAINSLAAKLLVERATIIEDFAAKAIETMREETPRVSHVVSESAKRFYAPRQNYSVLGAALARQFELDSEEARFRGIIEDFPEETDDE